MKTTKDKLIVDSGSTKTDWCVCREGEVIQALQTQGLNPYHQTEEVIAGVLQNELKGALRVELKPDTEVIFYGAGCANESSCNRVKNVIKAGNTEGKVEQDFFGRFLSPFKATSNKVIVPNEQEQAENPRSRSAKLRIAERI